MAFLLMKNFKDFLVFIGYAMFQNFYPLTVLELKLLIDLQFIPGYDTSTIVGTASEEEKRAQMALLTGSTPKKRRKK